MAKPLTYLLRADSRTVVFGVMIGLFVSFMPCPSLGYTPDSPAVRQMVGRAVAFLEVAPKRGLYYDELGGQTLVGLAIYKYYKRYGGAASAVPPYTATMLREIKAIAQSYSEVEKLDNYSLGISLIYLTEVQPLDNMGELSVFFNELQRRQRPNGGWTYASDQVGDTSQTQYAVLGMWSARKAGINVPQEMMDRAANWLIRTQTPAGAFGYHPKDPGNYMRVNQETIRPSLVAAGVGSLYVAMDFMGMSSNEPERAYSGGELPGALVPVLSDEQRKVRRRSRPSIDMGLCQKAMDDANRWTLQNGTYRPRDWLFYHLYALERYYSFRELVEGRSESEPRWYNEGIAVLMERQEESGAFKPPSGGQIRVCGRSVGTAFGVLFAVRSTKATIAKIEDRDGVLRGGYGMPSDLSEVRLKGNKIVAPAITGEVKDMVGMLEEGESDKIENLLENPEVLSLSRVKGAGDAVTVRLRRLVRNDAFQTRIVATRALARQGDLDNIPILIYALTDNDPRVVREAREGLRLTSRKFGGFGLPDQPTEDDVKQAVKQWKAWYKTIRPNATFVD